MFTDWADLNVFELLKVHVSLECRKDIPRDSIIHNPQNSLQLKDQARFRQRTFYLPNLIIELCTAKSEVFKRSFIHVPN
jgi:hypothetical protein